MQTEGTKDDTGETNEFIWKQNEQNMKRCEFPVRTRFL